jgi:hypothetical protein
MMIAKDSHLHLHGWRGHFHSKGPSASAGRESAAAQPETYLASGEHSHPVSASEHPRRELRPRAGLPRPLRPLLDACVLGGVTMTPVLSILGWVGLMLPIDSAMHQIATALLCVAMIWLGFALVAAHTLRGDARDESRRSGPPPSAR